jgi:hypothetical protein
MVIEYRFDRLAYLQETTSLGADPEKLLHELVNAMSDREFHAQYLHICRMHDIEPDMEKAGDKLLEDYSKVFDTDLTKEESE